MRSQVELACHATREATDVTGTDAADLLVRSVTAPSGVRDVAADETQQREQFVLYDEQRAAYEHVRHAAQRVRHANPEGGGQLPSGQELLGPGVSRPWCADDTRTYVWRFQFDVRSADPPLPTSAAEIADHVTWTQGHRARCGG